MFGLSEWVSQTHPDGPPAPTAVWADARVVPALLLRLGERDDHELAALRLLHGARGVLVLGPTTLLPWCEGVTYLANTREAPALYLPLHERPRAPLDLVARALSVKVGREGPVMLLRTPLLVASVVDARVVQRAALASLGAAGAV